MFSLQPSIVYISRTTSKWLAMETAQVSDAAEIERLILI